jgi:hypothetical protein
MSSDTDHKLNKLQIRITVIRETRCVEVAK